MFRERYMKTLSLKLDDSIFFETEELLNFIKIPRNRYINDAILYYNKHQKKNFLAKKIENESNLVRNESVRIFSEFEKPNEEHRPV